MSSIVTDAIEPLNTTGLKGFPIEILTGLCDGTSVTVKSGTYTFQNVTAIQQPGSSYVDLNGSVISYVPPTGTTRVIYEYTYYFDRTSDGDPLAHQKFFIDSTEVTKARWNTGGDTTYGTLATFKWIINCAATSAVAADGSFTSWTSAKELKIQSRRYGANNLANYNQTHYWDGTDGTHFHRPLLTITALR